MHFINNFFIFLPMFMALFWAIVLLSFPKTKNNAKHFLGVFMLGALGVYLSHAIFFSLEYKVYLLIDPLYMFSMLSVFPLYFCYIKLLTEQPKFSRKSLWLFLPALLTAIITTAIYLFMEQPVEFVKSYHYHLETSFIYKQDIWKTLQRYTLTIAKLFFFLQIIWVLTKGLKLINAYEKRLKEFYSNLEGRSINWAQYIVIIFSITGLMSAIANFTGRSFFYENHLIFIPSLVFGTLIFMIGYLGNLQSHTVSDLTNEEVETDIGKKHQFSIDNAENHQITKNIEGLKKKLLVLFEKEKIYKKADLKISHISELMNTNRTYVSRLINEEFSCSFSHFVNQYRVNEAKIIMESDIDMNLSIEEIADSAGFTSAGTLIRNFKLFFNITPGTFRKSIFRKNSS